MPDESKDQTSSIGQDDSQQPPQEEHVAKEQEESQEVMNILRNKEIFSAAMDGREVSFVYIHREVKNFYGGEGRQYEPAAAPAAAPSRPPRRIGELILNPLPQWEIDQAEEVYIPMPNHDAALKRLRQHGLIVLHGAADNGKRTAAIQLLTQLFADQSGKTALYELNPSI